MARPRRSGLEYFPLDVSAGTGDEVELLESEYGLEGFAVYIKLLQMIYKNSYYSFWDKKEQLIFCKKCGVTLERANDIIASCIEWGLFDKKLFDKYKILTSHGIQQRYVSAFGRRSALEMYKEYVLLTQSEINVSKTVVIVTLMQQNVAETTQSKEEKIKDKGNKKKAESKEEKIKGPIVNDAVIRIKNILEKGFGRMASLFEIEMLISYLDNGMEATLIEKAVEEAVLNNAKNMNYIKTILNRCLENKIYTLNAYNLSQEERKKKVKGNGASNPRTNTEDSEPIEDEFAKYAKQHGI